jgi:multiple sugar transport system permease protein
MATTRLATGSQASSVAGAGLSAAVGALNRLLLYATVTLFAVLAAFPFYWMVVGSFMKPVELFSPTPRLWPAAPDPRAYVREFELVPMARYFFNSIPVAFVTTVVSVLVSSAAGYSFAHLSFVGRSIWFALTLATLMVPYQSRVVPLFVMFASWGMLNTYPGVILPGLASAFGVFMMTQFFRTLPREMREAAVMDGAGETRIFLQIFFPLARPAVATLALFTFMQTWDQLLWPMIIAPRPDMRTVQVGLAFIHQTTLTLNHTMAAVVLSVIPMVAAFFLTQRHFIAGISAGAIKE